MTRFIVDLQEEEKIKMVDAGQKDRSKAGYIGEVIPPQLINDGEMMADLQTTLALLKFCN